MRPEIAYNNSEKPPYAYSNLKQTTLLNVVNMMRMTYASSMQFNENIDLSKIRGICHHGGKKGCHDDDFENDATVTNRFR